MNTGDDRSLYSWGKRAHVSSIATNDHQQPPTKKMKMTIKPPPKPRLIKNHIRLYYSKYCPLGDICKLVTMNSRLKSPQFRDVGLQFINGFFRKKFNRISEDQLINYIKKDPPVNIHIGLCKTADIITLEDGSNERMITPPEFKGSAYEIKKKIPPKIDIRNDGYGNSIHFCGEKKELVFDIDLCDYDEYDIRHCDCRNKKILCDICWLLIEGVVEVLSYFMKDILGYKSLMWVFSGGKGIHCWINDQQALSLSEQERKNIIKLVTMNDDKTMLNRLTEPLNPLMKRLYDNRLEKLFIEEGLKKRDILNNKGFIDRIFKMLDMINTNLKSFLSKEWYSIDGTISSIDKWSKLVAIITNTKQRQQKQVNPCVFIVFRLLYPILDEQVTSSLSHLIKSPFSINSSSTRISIPLVENDIKTLKIEQLPTLQGFIKDNGKNDLFNNGITILKQWINKY